MDQLSCWIFSHVTHLWWSITCRQFVSNSSFFVHLSRVSIATHRSVRKHMTQVKNCCFAFAVLGFCSRHLMLCQTHFKPIFIFSKFCDVNLGHLWWWWLLHYVIQVTVSFLSLCLQGGGGKSAGVSFLPLLSRFAFIVFLRTCRTSMWHIPCSFDDMTMLFCWDWHSSKWIQLLEWPRHHRFPATP